MNPAVGFALTLTGTLTWTRFIVLTVVQYAGGLTAAALCNALIPGGINARTTLGNGTTVVQGFFLEFLWVQLVAQPSRPLTMYVAGAPPCSSLPSTCWPPRSTAER